MEILWIRHFRTPGNGKRQYIGSTDEPLDPAGIPEPLPAYEKPGLLAVSPMKRCIQTADLLWPGLKYRQYPGFRELDFGEYERKTYEELKHEPAYQRWLKQGGFGAFPGGEDRVEFQKRCEVETRRLVADLLREGYERCAVVTHGGTIMAVLSAFDPEQRPFYHWQPENGAGYLTELEPADWEAGNGVFRRICRTQAAAEPESSRRPGRDAEPEGRRRPERDEEPAGMERLP